MHKETINPEHPFSKFSVGDLTTLEDRPNHLVRDDLLTFYHQHYSANIMGLVLLGPQSLDQLEAYTQDFFSQIPNSGKEKAPITAPWVTEAQNQHYIQIEPIKEVRRLSLSLLCLHWIIITP